MEKRKKGTKKGPKTILIVCEGYTEENMATAEKNRRKISAMTILNMKGCSPLEIVQTAKKKYLEDGGYDKIFCIFDRDNHGSIKKALQEIRDLAGKKRKKERLPIIAIVSNPCIEIWIICHFELPTIEYCVSSKNVKSTLKKHLPNYEENDPAIFRMIESKQKQAIKNSKIITESNKDPLQKPYTNVYEFIESL